MTELPERLQELNERIGSWLERPDYISYTDSMDACLELIAPKLQKLGCGWYIEQPKDNKLVSCHIHCRSLGKQFAGYNESAPIAFCLAVKKMLEAK